MEDITRNMAVQQSFWAQQIPYVPLGFGSRIVQEVFQQHLVGSMGWLRGKSTENNRLSHEKLDVPVIFPLTNQLIGDWVPLWKRWKSIGMTIPNLYPLLIPPVPGKAQWDFVLIYISCRSPQLPSALEMYLIWQHLATQISRSTWFMIDMLIVNDNINHTFPSCGHHEQY